MLKDPSIYNPKIEQKYFYLPKICRKGANSCKELFKNNSVSIIIFYPINLF